MARIVHGNHPFDAPKDQPMRIGREQVGYFTYPDIEFLATSDLNVLYVSTDKITLGYYELAPGSEFNPADHHPGDECYYLLSGELTEVNCDSGQACRLKAGDAILIPNGAPHGGYNFGTEKMKAVFALAPNMVKPGTQTFPTDLVGKRRVFEGEQEAEYQKWPAHAQEKVLPTIDRLGEWPVPDEELRAEPKYFRTTHDEDMLCVVNGYENPYLMKFAFSTMYLDFGELVLPAGGKGCRISDPESHPGQTVLYVKSGYLSAIINDTRETFKIYPDEALYIPENCTYQLMNYEAEPVHVIFARSK